MNLVLLNAQSARSSQVFWKKVEESARKTSDFSAIYVFPLMRFAVGVVTIQDSILCGTSNERHEHMQGQWGGLNVQIVTRTFAIPARLPLRAEPNGFTCRQVELNLCSLAVRSSTERHTARSEHCWEFGCRRDSRSPDRARRFVALRQAS
jgi:hypothetical protein